MHLSFNIIFPFVCDNFSGSFLTCLVLARLDFNILASCSDSQGCCERGINGPLRFAFKNNFPDLVFSDQICQVPTSAMVTAPFFPSGFCLFAWDGNLPPNPRLLSFLIECEFLFILTHTFRCMGHCVLHPPSGHLGDLNVLLLSVLLRYNAQDVPWHKAPWGM